MQRRLVEGVVVEGEEGGVDPEGVEVEEEDLGVAEVVDSIEVVVDSVVVEAVVVGDFNVAFSLWK